MPRSRPAAELGRETARGAHPGEGRLAAGIDRGEGGEEEGVDTGCFSQGPIGGGIPRVSLVIFAGPELQGIHKDTEQHPGQPAPRHRTAGPHQQRTMALVQRPHGGHEVERTFGMLPAPEQQLGTAGDQSHALHSKESPPAKRRVGRVETT